MKITREQIEAWNKKCGNGFKVNCDRQFYGGRNAYTSTFELAQNTF